MFCDSTAEHNAHTEDWQHQVEPRYATEHILRPDFFQITLDRGYLSGETGRYGGLLYFSEGAHYRGRPTTNTDPQLANAHMGFLFDPVDLEYTFGAIPTFMRYHQVLEEATNDPEIGSRQLWQKFLNPEPRREQMFTEQTVLSYGKERPYVQHVRQTMQQEQFGLEALLKFQRKYDVDVEPEFVVLHRVPLARAIGVSDETGVYWINPETRGNKMLKWDLFPVDPSELGGREPGSFAPETVQSLIIPDEFKLHGGRRAPLHRHVAHISPHPPTV